MGRKTALITGITGQDGSYLAEYLLTAGYAVHGIVRQAELDDSARLAHIAAIRDHVTLHVAELTASDAVQSAFAAAMPSECYHLAAQSVVSYSVADESGTLNTNVGGTQCVLAAVRSTVPHCRFFFASSSEMFGRAHVSPQTEETPVSPRSVYGISKVAGWFLTRYYREMHGIHACCGIMYNHESVRRSPGFVTRKITLAVARIASGCSDKVRLGNLDAKRDWGHARDYVRAMWLMLQRDHPSDYVIATGVQHSVREFCDLAFRRAGLRWEDWVETDPALYRASEAAPLVGNPLKAQTELGWHATTRFEDLVNEMVDHDCEVAGLRMGRRQCA